MFVSSCLLLLIEIECNKVMLFILVLVYLLALPMYCLYCLLILLKVFKNFKGNEKRTGPCFRAPLPVSMN